MKPEIHYKRVLRFLWVCLALPTLLSVESLHAGSTFSADVKRFNSNQPAVQADGRIVVGDGAIRTESKVNGELLVVIYQHSNKQVFTLLPAKRQFSRLSDGRLDLQTPPTPRDPNSPCQRDNRYQCRLRGMESLEGRQVEHWDITAKTSEKESRSFQLWVDMELGVAIRERYEDGTVVEMQNIRVGSQDSQLFKVPPGFQEVVASPSGK